MRAYETRAGVYCPGCSYRIARIVPLDDGTGDRVLDWPKGWIWDREAERMVRRRSRHARVAEDGASAHVPLTYVTVECPRCREDVQVAGTMFRGPLPSD